MTEASDSNSRDGRLVCPANPEPGVKKFIMAFLLFAWGAYCFYELYIAKKLGPGDEHYDFTFYTMIPAFALTIVPLVWGIVQLRRKLIADNEGLGFVGKTKVRWENITGLEPLGKGRLDVEYAQDGQEDVLHLDSYFIKNFNELVKMIEAKRPDLAAAGEQAEKTPDQPDSSDQPTG